MKIKITQNKSIIIEGYETSGIKELSSPITHLF